MSVTREFRVLGPVEAAVGGTRIPLPGTKPRAIVTMLGLNAGSTVSADVLADVLWGESAPRTARKALQTHISSLRSVLGEGAIVTSGDYGWTLGHSMIDVATFRQLVGDARAAQRRGSPADASDLFRTALGLWRGPPALPGTVRAQAERTLWTETHEAVVDDLTDARLAIGEHSMVIGELEATLAVSPLRERRWAQLCMALYRSGRQGDALAAYQRARAVLIDELGIEPGPDLIRLERAILNQDPSLAMPASHVEVVTTPVTRPGPDRRRAALPVPPSRFIGRAGELQALTQILGAHRLVTVTGPGGVGKSRLAIEAAKGMAIERVWYADLANARAGFVGEAVAAVLGIAESEDRTLGDAIADWIGDSPGLLLLDGCERVRDAVAVLTTDLLRACPHLFVLATSRERLGAEAERVIPVPPMDLSRPSDSGISDAEALFLDRARAVDSSLDLDMQLVREVCRRCDGLALTIELAAARCASIGLDGLLAGLDDRLQLLVSSHAATERHRSLRAVLDWSYDVLAPEEQRLFERLGLFAGRFDIAAAASLAYPGEADVAARRAAVVHLIGRLTEQNLVTFERTETGSRWRLLDVVGSYAKDRFDQSPDRAAVYESYLAWAAATADRLERQLLAGDPWSAEFGDVIDDLRSALLADADIWPDAADRLALALALARLYARRGSFTLAQLAYESATALARKTGDAVQLARAALGASEPGMLFGVTQERRVALLEEARTGLDNLKSGTGVRLTARLATELYWSDDLPRSLALATEAFDVAARLGEHGAIAHASYALHYVTRGPGVPQVRLRLAQQITRAAGLSGETQLELAGRAARVVALTETGDLEGARSDVQQLSNAADRLHHPEFQWYVSVYRLVNALVTGQFDAADEYATAARAASEVAPEFTVGQFFAEAITDLRVRPPTARFDHGQRLAAMAARFPRITLWQCLSALHDAQSGEPAAADDVTRLAGTLTAIDTRDGHWLVSCSLIGEAAARVGDVASATAIVSALDPFAGELAVAGRVGAFRGSVAHTLGLLAASLGDLDGAVSYLRASADAHAEIGAAPFHARDLAALERLATA